MPRGNGLPPGAWRQTARSERGSGKSAGAFRVETLPKRPQGLRLRAGRATGVHAGGTMVVPGPCPQNYALTLRALLELL
jgi:hypothetical protein